MSADLGLGDAESPSVRWSFGWRFKGRGARLGLFGRICRLELTELDLVFRPMVWRRYNLSLWPFAEAHIPLENVLQVSRPGGLFTLQRLYSAVVRLELRDADPIVISAGRGFVKALVSALNDRGVPTA